MQVRKYVEVRCERWYLDLSATRYFFLKKEQGHDDAVKRKGRDAWEMKDQEEMAQLD